MSTLIKNILESEAIHNLKPDFSLLKIIPEKTAQEAQFLIFSSPKKNELQALTTNNHPDLVKQLLDQLHYKGFQIEIFYTSNDGFQEAFQRYHQMQQLQSLQNQQTEKEQKAEGKSAISIIKERFEQRESQDPGTFIKDIIRLSFQAGASDLHFQSEESGITMKIRLDGILHQILSFTHQEFWKYIQKIKFISGVKMNIDYLPQDGRFSFEASDPFGNLKEIDARVSFMPGISTENTVIRFLDANNNFKNLEEIGFSSQHIEILQQNIHKTTGIIIITGPTGSGKTTTLYTILKQLNTGEKKIITLEDPIEYKISGLQQSQINYEKGYNYETGLKAILRQDPDLILVGETRTKETANIAINAALTGHLVFTTLHTNSAFEAITRLSNMGVENYLLAPALQLIAGQRLIRKLCPHCKQKRPATSQEIQLINKTFPQQNFDGNLYSPQGCPLCNHTGYQGRIAIIELLAITDDLRDAMIEGTSNKHLKSIAEKSGFISLQTDGISKVIRGDTTLEEIYRVSY